MHQILGHGAQGGWGIPGMAAAPVSWPSQLGPGAPPSAGTPGRLVPADLFSLNDKRTAGGCGWQFGSQSGLCPSQGHGTGCGRALQQQQQSRARAGHGAGTDFSRARAPCARQGGSRGCLSRAPAGIAERCCSSLPPTPLLTSPCPWKHNFPNKS